MQKLVSALVLLGSLLSGANAWAKKPDIVVFLADDLSYGDISPYGSHNIVTPSFELIAAAGMKFSNAFVASPSCAPSRAALLTGLYPIRNGAMYNHQAPAAGVKKWPAYFKEFGYEVVAIGKVAHYAQVRDYGFEHTSHYNYHEDECIAAAVEWLEKREDSRPLCLIVGTNWPHVPWPATSSVDAAALKLPVTVVDSPESRKAWSRYAEAVKRADRDVGLIYEAAKRKLGRNMMFIFSSDHGSQFPFGKWNNYDAGIRTPLIAVWPDHIKAGAITNAMVSWVDLLPTCLEAAGGAAPDLDGRSFFGVMLGKSREHRDRVFASHSGDGKQNEYPLRAVRSERFKYIRNLRPESEYHTNVDRAVGPEAYFPSWVRLAKTDKHARFLVSRYFTRPAEELYDVVLDPNELVNLAADPRFETVLAQLRESLDEHMKRTGDFGLVSERASKAQMTITNHN